MKQVFLFFFMFSSFANVESFLPKCFETLEYNFKQPTYGPLADRNLSTYESFENSFTYKNIETGDYEPIHVLNIFTGYNDLLYGYTPTVLFDNLGIYNISQTKFEYHVDEDVYMRDTQSYQYKKVDHKVSVSIARFGDVFSGHINLISYIRKYDREFTFKIRKTECPTLD